MTKKEIDNCRTYNSIPFPDFFSLSYPVSQFSWICQRDVTELCSRGHPISGDCSPCSEQTKLLESDEVNVSIVRSGSMTAARD